MADLRNYILRLYNDFTLLDSELPTLVYFNKEGRCLEFHQLNVSVRTPYISFLYKFDNMEFGILLPSDFEVLMKGLAFLFESSFLDNPEVLVSPSKYKTQFYSSGNLRLPPGAQLHLELKFVSYKSKLIMKLLFLFSKDLVLLKNGVKNGDKK